MSAMSIIMSLSGAEIVPIKTFLFWGQSNMNGLGKNSEVSGADSKYTGVRTNNLILGGLTSGAFQLYQSGLNSRTVYNASYDFGPECSCAYDIADSLGEKIAIIKWGQDGTPFTEPGVTDWNVNSVDELFNTVIYDPETHDSFCEAGTTLLTQLGYSADWRAMFGAHGERDATLGNTGYYEDFLAFINAVRLRLNAPNLPNIFLKLRDIATIPVANCNEIQADMAQIVIDDSNSIMIDCDDLGTSLHYNTAQLITVGQRMATAYLNTL